MWRHVQPIARESISEIWVPPLCSQCFEAEHPAVLPLNSWSNWNASVSSLAHACATFPPIHKPSRYFHLLFHSLALSSSPSLSASPRCTRPYLSLSLSSCSVSNAYYMPGWLSICTKSEILSYVIKAKIFITYYKQQRGGKQTTRGAVTLVLR